MGGGEKNATRFGLRGHQTRRALLGGAAAAASFAFVPPGEPALAQSKKKRGSANSRINIAVIGAGGKGVDDMNQLVGENIVALADPDMGRVERSLRNREGAVPPEREALKAAYEKAAQYADYRQMLDSRKDIDAVLIAAPDHHHALAARMAMERGLHVYVQKPLTYSVKESRRLEDLARKNSKLVTQMGNQGHSSDPGRRVVELLRGGVIGRVNEVHVWTNRPVWPQGIAKPPPQLKPTSLDWDIWLGPADVDWGYHPDYAHFNWRGWVPFGTGALGDMGAHLLDFPFWALELGLPTRIETRHSLWGGDPDPWDRKRPEVLTSFPLASVTHYEFGQAKGGPVKLIWQDGGLMPPTPKDLPAGVELDPEGGVLYLGASGALVHRTYGQDPILIGEDAQARAAAVPQTLPRIIGSSRGHEMNWVRAIRGEEAVSSPFDVAGPLNETMLLGIVAMRADQPLTYDTAAGAITNLPAANALLERTYRAGWAV